MNETGVAWRRVGLFYGIAFGGAVLVALLVWLCRDLLGGGALAGVALTAVLYMPLPMVAGLVTERVARRRPLIAREWQEVRHHFWRTYGRNALVAVIVVVAIVALGFVAAWLAGLMGVPGAGHIAAGDAELLERLRQLNPAVSAANVPPLPVLLGITMVQGLIAGVTINGLFALGEEYGWRGVLADELRPLGLVRASLVTGVLWGLWHAPIIVLGHNYGSEWAWGIPVMVTWTVPMAFLLTWARERTGSVLAPALLHGAFNGVVGVFAIAVVGANVLIGLPVGIVLSVTLAVLALVVWRIPTGRSRVEASAVGEPLVEEAAVPPRASGH